MMKRLRDFTDGAFSLVEMLVAAAIGAAVITGAVLAFGVISKASTRGGRVDLQIPASTYSNLYGTATNRVTIWPNPSYSEAAKARLLRDKLMEDVSSATAVFCLGRDGLWSGARSGSVTFPAQTDLRNVATPSAFRQFLASNNFAGVTIFPTNQTGPLVTSNATIFVLGGLSSQNLAAGTSNTLSFVATYEVDFVPVTGPSGVYATVRRYDPDEGSMPTDYYHSFYPGEDNRTGGFRPLAVFFGRQAGGGVYDIAPNHPFTFVWWPDPLVSRLVGAGISSAGGLPLRSSYANMAGRTSLFSVIPAFPGQ